MVISAQIDASKAARGLEQIAQGIQEAVKATLDQSAQSAVQGAQAVVPVVTGRLRDSIGVKDQ
ncbi:MAG: HK97 gp10 family phage protein, partial [Pyrinomonadaceae bacterium]|nr:HK97 gp10 family phage protein [Pyrinomonadaceae bacterium]